MTTAPRQPLTPKTHSLWKGFLDSSTQLAILGIVSATMGCGEPTKDDNHEKDDSNKTADQGSAPRHHTKLTNGLRALLVSLEGGTFSMGSPENETRRDLDEHRHQVTLSTGFYFWSTEVTQKQWKEIMKSEPWVDGAYTRSGVWPRFPLARPSIHFPPARMQLLTQSVRSGSMNVSRRSLSHFHRPR